MNCHVRMATLLVSIAALGASAMAQGAVLGPYSPDVNTVHLFHFDEAAEATVAADAAGGNSLLAVDGNPIGAIDSGPLPARNDILGFPGYFGNSAFVSSVDRGLGYDGNNNAQFDPDRINAAPGDDAISLSSLVGANGAFTLEALVNLPTGQALNQFRQIVSTDSTASPRGFQFRITNAGALEFNGIGSPGIHAILEIPLSGDHAFVNDAWFHVAFAYDGEGNGSMYWTKVGESVIAANLIGMVTDLADLDGTIFAPLVIGNDNRNTFDSGFRGLMDEVRISNVARGPGDFIFSDAPPIQAGDFNGDGNVDGADFVIWQTNFPNNNGDATLATGDANGDGNVDGADFVVWQTNFPFAAGSGATPVPEPTAAMLGFMALIGLIGAAHRKLS